MHQTLCYGQKGLCKEMLPIDGSELLKYLRKVEFTGDFNIIIVPKYLFIKIRAQN